MSIPGKRPDKARARAGAVRDRTQAPPRDARAPKPDARAPKPDARAPEPDRAQRSGPRPPRPAAPAPAPAARKPKAAPPRLLPGPARSGTVAIIGRPNVGKSTLLNAALEVPLAIVTPTPQTTRESLLGVVRRNVEGGGTAELLMLDTPGLHRAQSALARGMNRAARRSAADADVVVFVVDAHASCTPSFDSRSKARELGSIHPLDVSLLADIPLSVKTVLALNKIDRVKNKAALLPLLEAFAKLRPFEAIVPLSARADDGVDRLLGAVAALLPVAEPRFGPDDLTDRPAKFFVSEYVREQVLLRAREEVPHATAVSIDAFEEAPTPSKPGRAPVARVAATLHVERQGHKKILIGAGGSMLKQIGTDARARIEELLGYRIHLELFVRVTEGWRDSPAMLDELGLSGREGST